MPRDIGVILSEMLETIALIETALVGKTREDLARNDILRLAIQRAIEIISEASRHIPDVLLLQAPDVPWRRSAPWAISSDMNSIELPTTSYGTSSSAIFRT
ncbi:HepT-like ribonuclease domain-containing protein [Mycoplana rhizolycopersici]|uniref:HepT-like ribonuclease domain-containing protein n=1 Tax=Mycoplana rhizolycopersici TaxID=2746702 RepID=UPI001FECF3E1|nr:HepT-like ribonuclease domain-containing protein [Rhizobium rhizolycopersici]